MERLERTINGLRICLTGYQPKTVTSLLHSMSYFNERECGGKILEIDFLSQSNEHGSSNSCLDTQSPPLIRCKFGVESSYYSFVNFRGKVDAMYEALAMRAIIDGLARVGQYAIHSACIEYSSTAEVQKCILIAAGSNVGKTTAALSLAMNGMKILSDDLSFFSQSSVRDIARAWGFPRICRLRPYTIKLLPELAHLVVRQSFSEKKNLRICDLPGMSSKNFSCKYVLSAIILLESPNTNKHRSRIESHSGAFKRLRGGIHPAGETTLIQLLRELPILSVSVGPNLKSFGDFVRNNLNPIT